MISYYHYLFWCSTRSRFGLWAGSFVLLTHSSSFFPHFLAFWDNKILQAHLTLHLPQPWNQPFLQWILDHFCGEWSLEAKDWALAMPIVTEMFAAPWPSQWAELGHKQPCSGSSHLILLRLWHSKMEYLSVGNFLTQSGSNFLSWSGPCVDSHPAQALILCAKLLLCRDVLHPFRLQH